VIQIDAFDAESLLLRLSAANIMFTYSSILVERRIIFISENPSILSGCVQAALAMIFPLSWQHIYVPVLPPSLLNYVCAPMPYIVGVIKSCMDEVRTQ